MSVGTRDLVLIVAGVDHSAAVLRAAVRSVSTDSEFVSFLEAQHGGKRDYHLAMDLFQDVSGLSLWRVIWSQRTVTLPFELWPMGRPAGGVPTATQPRAVGTATVDHPDGDFLGGEADPDPEARMTTAVEWLCDEMPVLEP
ncbi:hypothetical protein [Promicromonospora sp. NPDC050880]|uniref:hypothetical protein n=1 Tax=Promicromonospora sp. NPDC050880 TaxID=3364406 RepID=UPI0037ADAB3D